MLANLRRKVGLASGISTPVPTNPPPSFAENMILSPTFQDPAMPQPFTMGELGFIWPNDRSIFSPSAIPIWLQEQVCRFDIIMKFKMITGLCQLRVFTLLVIHRVLLTLASLQMVLMAFSSK